MNPCLKAIPAPILYGETQTGAADGGTLVLGKWSQTKQIFISYSSKDTKEINELTLHLDLYKNNGSIDYYLDTKMQDSEEWNPQIMQEMERANVLLMLLSPGYFSSPYIVQKEIPMALKYLAEVKKTKQVYWILLKPCSYTAWPEIAKHQVYPQKEYDPVKGVGIQKAICEYPSQDRKWTELLQFVFDEDR